MAGLLGSLYSAKSGMNVSQASIQTTSHNINNMNTPGYTRQRVEQSAKSAYSNPGFNSSLGAGQLGTGVEATNIMRIRNTFYDYQYRSESHNYGEVSTKYQYYTNMETIFNEPSDTSISASIANFFSSWQELSKNPTDVGSKDIMVQNTKYLADNISNIKKKLDSLAQQADKKLNEDVEEVNNMLEQLKKLDKQIKIVEGSGKTPNDLMDERDKVLDDLSMKLDLNNDDVKQLLENTHDASGNFTPLTVDDIKGLGNVSGEIQGSLDMIEKINEYTTSLKDLAKGIAEGVNEVLSDGGAKPSDLFIFDADKDPILSVNKNLSDNPRDFEISTETALAMYKLKDEKITIGGETTTIDKFYNQMIQKLGNESQEIIRQERNQSKIIKEIDNTRLNTSGVSLDEEMVNLIQFQHAYSASAKVVSTIDSLLDVVINGLKR